MKCCHGSDGDDGYGMAMGNEISSMSWTATEGEQATASGSSCTTFMEESSPTTNPGVVVEVVVVLADFFRISSFANGREE
jgi:hypothetical protein